MSPRFPIDLHFSKFIVLLKIEINILRDISAILNYFSNFYASIRYDVHIPILYQINIQMIDFQPINRQKLKFAYILALWIYHATHANIAVKYSNSLHSSFFFSSFFLLPLYLQKLPFYFVLNCFHGKAIEFKTL